jgi:hypothetical protein
VISIWSDVFSSAVTVILSVLIDKEQLFVICGRECALSMFLTSRGYMKFNVASPT